MKSVENFAKNFRVLADEPHVGKLLPIPDTFESVFKPGREGRDERFWSLLKHVVSTTRFRIPDGDVVILDLACGVCEEAIVLASFFSTGIFGIPSRRARLIGVDRDAADIYSAAVQAARPLPLDNGFMVLPSCEFYVADATDLSKVPAVPAQVDFALVRHQQSIEFQGNANDPWPAIFQQGIDRLKPGGLLLVTSFDKPEHEYLMNLVRGLKNAEVAWSGKNPHAAALAHETRKAYIDGFLVVLRKK